MSKVEDAVRANLDRVPERIGGWAEASLGNVGAIGGLNSKASAVMQVGVKYFLVPANQPPAGDDPDRLNPDSIEAARRVVGDNVEIIPVATIDEALAALERLGGDPLPK